MHTPTPPGIKTILLIFCICASTIPCQALEGGPGGPLSIPPQFISYELSVYLFLDGDYFKKSNNNKYIKVTPPIGITVASLPKHAISPAKKEESYYECCNAYYTKNANGYRVIKLAD